MTVHEPIDYVVVRTPSSEELVSLELAVKTHRAALEHLLEVFEVASTIHPTQLPDKQIRQVLWQFDESGGIEPGRFVAGLLDVIKAADPENRRKLRLDLVDIVQYLPHGVVRLQAVLGREYRCGCSARYVSKNGAHRPGCVLGR